MAGNPPAYRGLIDLADSATAGMLASIFVKRLLAGNYGHGHRLTVGELRETLRVKPDTFRSLIDKLHDAGMLTIPAEDWHHLMDDDTELTVMSLRLAFEADFAKPETKQPELGFAGDLTIRKPDRTVTGEDCVKRGDTNYWARADYRYDPLTEHLINVRLCIWVTDVGIPHDPEMPPVAEREFESMESAWDWYDHYVPVATWPTEAFERWLVDKQEVCFHATVPAAEIADQEVKITFRSEAPGVIAELDAVTIVYEMDAVLENCGERLEDWLIGEWETLKALWSQKRPDAAFDIEPGSVLSQADAEAVDQAQEAIDEGLDDDGLDDELTAIIDTVRDEIKPVAIKGFLGISHMGSHVDVDYEGTVFYNQDEATITLTTNKPGIISEVRSKEVTVETDLIQKAANEGTLDALMTEVFDKAATAYRSDF